MAFILNLAPYMSGGLTYQLSLLASYHLYSTKKNIKMYFNDSNWIFKHSKGWRDYFDSLNIIDLSSNNLTDIHNVTYDASINTNTLGEFNIYNYKYKVSEYREAFSKIIVFNQELQNKMQNIIDENNLVEGEFDAIFIRRGDKMFYESFYNETLIYINKLIEKNTKTIFVHTDDYNSYLEVKNIINENYDDIKVICICPEWQQGMVHNISDIKIFTTNNSEYLNNSKNKEYIENWLKNKHKTTEELSPSEMKEHVETSIIGLEICLKSRFLVLELSTSNIARYLCIRHNNINNVISIDNKHTWNNNSEIHIPASL